MTSVIREGGGAWQFWGIMKPPSPVAGLAEMARVHRALIERARRTDRDRPSAVLDLGVSVAALSAQACSAFEQNRFLDEAVLESLLAERRSLAEDLDLLASLSAANPRSPDIEPLSTALLHRIEELLEREDRVLFQPLIRLAASSGEKARAAPTARTAADRRPQSGCSLPEEVSP